jgi:membrane protease YdiL (CAAX protease family)
LRLLAFTLVTVESLRRSPDSPLSRNEGGIVFLLAVGGFIAGQVVGLVLTGVASSLANFHGSLSRLSLLSEPPWWYIASGLLGIWLGCLAATFLVQRRYEIIDAATALRPRTVDLAYVALGAFLQGAVWLVYLPFNVNRVAAPANKLLGSATGWEFALLAVMTAVGAPIVEELLFRGVLLRSLQAMIAARSRPLSLSAAIAIDGLLFGLFHGELLQLPALAVLGMILATLYVRTKRLVPCIVTHASFNAVALVSIIVQRSHS